MTLVRSPEEVKHALLLVLDLRRGGVLATQSVPEHGGGAPPWVRGVRAGQRTNRQHTGRDSLALWQCVRHVGGEEGAGRAGIPRGGVALSYFDQ